MERGRVAIFRDVTFVESQPGSAAGEAATEADKADVSDVDPRDVSPTYITHTPYK